MLTVPSRKLSSESFWITLLSKAGQKINHLLENLVKAQKRESLYA